MPPYNDNSNSNGSNNNIFPSSSATTATTTRRTPHTDEDRGENDNIDGEENGDTMMMMKTTLLNGTSHNHQKKNPSTNPIHNNGMEDDNNGNNDNDGEMDNSNQSFDDNDEHDEESMDAFEDSQTTQPAELTQLTQTADHLTQDETTNMMLLSSSSSQQSPRSTSNSTSNNSPPPPPTPWGRVVPCNLTAGQYNLNGGGGGGGSKNNTKSRSSKTKHQQQQQSSSTTATTPNDRRRSRQQKQQQPVAVAVQPVIPPMEFVSDQEEYIIGRSMKADVTASPVTYETNPNLSERDETLFRWGHSLISNRHCRIFIDRTAIGNDSNLGGVGMFRRHRHPGLSPTTTNAANLLHNCPVYIEDMSGNGTIINQQTKLQKGEKRQLHSGDEILLIDPNILRKRVSSERMIHTVLSTYSFTFIQSRPRKPCVDPRAMNYYPFQQQQRLNNNNNQQYYRFNGGGGAATTATSTALFSGRMGLPGINRPYGNGMGHPNHPQPQQHRPFGGIGGGGAFGRTNHNNNNNNNNGRQKRSLSFSTTSPMSRSSAAESRIELVYDIREVLGDGTSGQVRRCIHRKTGQEYAVKVIALRRQFDMSTMEREVNLLQSLDHPYIVQLVDVFLKPNEAMYIVMELVKGGDLFDRISENGNYTEIEARQTIRRLLSAVFYLHEGCNIVHRDLKPENILCSSSSVNIKLADFGLAKTVKADGLKTFCGTPAYFAPEVLQRRGTIAGEGRYGMPADMWSIGVILYILLIGQPPFDADMDDPRTFEFESNDSDPICQFPAARDLVQQLLRQDPKRRINIRQACDHPWINIDDGDTHCHPLDDPAVTTKKRLFDEKSVDDDARDRRDGRDEMSDDGDDASVRSKDSILSKEEFAHAAVSHIRTDSVVHVGSSSTPPAGTHGKKDEKIKFENDEGKANGGIKSRKRQSESDGYTDAMDDAELDRPRSPSPRDVAKQMSIDSSTKSDTQVKSKDPTKIDGPCNTSTDEEMTPQDTSGGVPPSEGNEGAPTLRSPLSKMNLNDQGNPSTDQALNDKSPVPRNPTTEEASPAIRKSSTHQTAVTPTSSNIRNQKGGGGGGQSGDDNGEALNDVDGDTTVSRPRVSEAGNDLKSKIAKEDESDDDISQFSSDDDSIESYGSSASAEGDDTSSRRITKEKRTSADHHKPCVSEEKTKTKKRRGRDGDASSTTTASTAGDRDLDSNADPDRPSKRRRSGNATSSSSADHQAKTKKSTQTTLIGWFKKVPKN